MCQEPDPRQANHSRRWFNLFWISKVSNKTNSLRCELYQLHHQSGSGDVGLSARASVARLCSTRSTQKRLVEAIDRQWVSSSQEQKVGVRGQVFVCSPRTQHFFKTRVSRLAPNFRLPSRGLWFGQQCAALADGLRACCHKATLTHSSPTRHGTKLRRPLPQGQALQSFSEFTSFGWASFASFGAGGPIRGPLARPQALHALLASPLRQKLHQVRGLLVPIPKIDFQLCT